MKESKLRKEAELKFMEYNAIVSMLGHKQVDFLKIDIEGGCRDGMLSLSPVAATQHMLHARFGWVVCLVHTPTCCLAPGPLAGFEFDVFSGELWHCLARQQLQDSS